MQADTALSAGLKWVILCKRLLCPGWSGVQALLPGELLSSPTSKWYLANYYGSLGEKKEIKTARKVLLKFVLIHKHIAILWSFLQFIWNILSFYLPKWSLYFIDIILIFVFGLRTASFYMESANFVFASL